VSLTANLLLFGRVLRGLGLDVSPGRMRDLIGATEHVGIGDRVDFREAARSLLVHRHEDMGLFDAAFEAFWRKPVEGSTHLDLRALGETRRFRRPRFAAPEPPRSRLGDTGEDFGPDPADPPLLQPVLVASAQERLRHKDFGEMTAEELDEVAAFVRGAALHPETRRTRRHQPGPGPLLDLRRTLRASRRHGGEVLTWARRERKAKPRPIVVIADVSGSMERYTRILLLFSYALAQRPETPVEAFVFGTRLTRITRHLRGQDAERALSLVSHAVPDWSGGTRIGDALHTFNFEWARRVLGRRPVVLLVSDGWDRGDPVVLAEEMARLHRSCGRLVWLNPLLGAPGYEPLARGMQAALPHLDAFLTVHNLASLEDLGRHLANSRHLPKGEPRVGARGSNLHGDLSPTRPPSSSRSLHA
jgi:uncharacterized protein with von Willebrand factor type A (vWA) domain